MFFAASALLFIASAAGTILWCGSMTGGMLMPGGWTMSMAWMRMPGQSWFGAAASFLGMWEVMMAAMMLPSLVPALAQFRCSLRRDSETSLGGLTAIVGAAYFLPWTAFGAIAYPLGVLVATAEMRWQGLAGNVPIASGIVLLLAGCFQLTPWKARQLGCCRLTFACKRAGRPNLKDALEQGIRLGLHCVLCCSSFMIILLTTGVMNLWGMGIIALAITAERLAPWPTRVARGAGAVIIALGAVLIAHALHTR